MSCLSREFSLTSQKDFSKVYNSKKRWHKPSFAIFYKEENILKLAFVASKKVSKKAVYRNKAKRLLKSVVLEIEQYLKPGFYIFVAKEPILKIEYKKLKSEISYAIKKLTK